jgi:hypothetical protein
VVKKSIDLNTEAKWRHLGLRDYLKAGLRDYLKAGLKD